MCCCEDGGFYAFIRSSKALISSASAMDWSVFKVTLTSAFSIWETSALSIPALAPNFLWLNPNSFLLLRIFEPKTSRISVFFLYGMEQKYCDDSAETLDNRPVG